MFYNVEIEYYDTTDDTVKWAYYGTTGFSTRATETPARTVIQGRVVNPALIRRDVFDVGTTGGEGRVGFGELTLNNEDQAMYVWKRRSVTGRIIRVYISDSLRAPYPAAWHRLFTGTMSQIEISQAAVKIQIRDRQVFAGNQFQPLKYAGDNVLPDGTEGIASDLKGKPKPRVVGAAFNCEAVPVNTSRLIYQFDSGALRDIPAMYDAGVLLTPGADYADSAAMFATQPARGGYRKLKASGMVRLGSTPEGLITGDAIKGLTPLDRTIGNTWLQELRNAGVDDSLINLDSVAALNAKNKATIGMFYREETTVSAVLGDIARSGSCWWASNNAGLLGIQRLEPPDLDEAVDLELHNGNITDNTLRLVPLTEGGLPVWNVTVRGVPNHTVQTNGLAFGVGAARRSRLAQTHQDATATDPLVKVAYLLAPELVVETKLSCLSAVQREADFLLARDGVKRDRYELDVYGNAAFLASIDLGKVARITSNTYELTAGQKFRVLGYQLNPTAGSASLTVWG